MTEPTLRTSARISEEGETKRYGNTNARIHKTGKEYGGTRELDPMRQVVLLEALHQESLAAKTLKLGQAR